MADPPDTDVAGLGISGTTSSSRRKRERDGGAAGTAGLRGLKRSRLGSGFERADITAEQDDSSESANKCSAEKARDSKATSLVNPRNNGDESLDSRISCCPVAYPPGRAIDKFKSVKEFLEALRDAIKGHKSLYQDGRILHRDVTKNNIIITDTESDKDPKGMLIDLDLAKELDSGPSGARHRTGTMEFMAIEALKGKAHTYRHDLESFFYILLWVIIRHGHKTGQKPDHKSRLRDWYLGTYNQMAQTKMRDMGRAGFRELVKEFPREFEGIKCMAEELRSLLFPGLGRMIFMGTYSGPEMVEGMYNEVISIFNEAIEAVE